MTMAKKVKAAKKAKVAKTTKATKKTAVGRRAGAAKVPLHKIVHFVRLLQRRKRAAKFVAHAKAHEASITLPGASRIAIHNFLEQHDLLADACPTPDPWKCPED
jgi:hypothetical protein